jgi:dihydroflavonol-4-reductase
MARYLVTGATGFLGGHLARALLRHGHEVVAFARTSDRDLERQGVIPRRGDVLEAAHVRDAAAGCDGVFHCAGFVSRDPNDAEALFQVHVVGTKTVLSACREAGVRRAVVASTSGIVAVSDDPDRIATEADEAPIGMLQRWPYYRAKWLAEHAALASNGDGFEVVCVNPTLLLGPGDARKSSTEDVALFLEGKLPAVPAGGLSFVDVRDAAEAMRLAMEKGRAGERYLVGACNMTLRAFFEKVARVSGKNTLVVPLPRAPEVATFAYGLLERAAKRLGRELPVDPVSFDMAQRYWYLDATKAETELGWSSRDPLDTLADTVRDLEARAQVTLD